ncbi:hypothetical protein [Cylindrospermum sp. FACHB-282]|uniref:hypothetical protein n=1 Tax=Cylindrospermum sp. FACHB-282 TaxID=2692794 RepID=UPI0016864250|nr:hypothetical protein [Cylindrospermum sp. FACHB-282]MBD2385810.1 hypothetical protein [Cylindrospermum sp. FACHB-282]
MDRLIKHYGFSVAFMASCSEAVTEGCELTLSPKLGQFYSTLSTTGDGVGVQRHGGKPFLV